MEYPRRIHTPCLALMSHWTWSQGPPGSHPWTSAADITRYPLRLSSGPMLPSAPGRGSDSSRFSVLNYVTLLFLGLGFMLWKVCLGLSTPPHPCSSSCKRTEICVDREMSGSIQQPPACLERGSGAGPS